MNIKKKIVKMYYLKVINFVEKSNYSFLIE